MLWAAISSLVGGILLVAGVPKLNDGGRTVRAVRGFRLLPEALVSPVGRALPAVEVIVGAALVFGVAPLVSGSAAIVLFASFAVGLTVNLLRGRRDLDCGCFAFAAGTDEIPHIGWWHVARAAMLTLLSAAVVLAPTVTTVDRIAGTGIGLFVVATACVAVYARSVMSFGRRPIDDYLTNAAIEYRAGSSISRY
ncbi:MULTISPECIES: MauE/DoxX family redox-associated membrane protein [Nocardiaceae]|uniref:Membrane protein YphA (DoxX/SURF4 family) n=1 Tax=Rhodococcoides corynebacterioides TaxID=53972 RepID=A0ABS2KV04_9NOCA|nr:MULTISPECIES: MauE/DoxX family redox-associated membrane protein [Rhodococcus]MBM7415780.1 putative membrane protein YphA (DoxX/SURF4 family) [Rhodococcus corynebacterioides]MBP1118242.1 putative membrane protein YphA (DoxX/SURF4 family) [Rhodococcus sp. PvP016]